MVHPYRMIHIHLILIPVPFPLSRFAPRFALHTTGYHIRRPHHRVKILALKLSSPISTFRFSSVKARSFSRIGAGFASIMMSFARSYRIDPRLSAFTFCLALEYKQ